MRTPLRTRILAGAWALAAALACPTQAQPVSADGVWAQLAEAPEQVLGGLPAVRPVEGRALFLDLAALEGILKNAPMERPGVLRRSAWVITLPRPDGVWERFAFAESPVMEPALQARYPQIRTYMGQGLDDRGSTLRFDLTQQGFHAQVIRPSADGSAERGAWYIDPLTRGDRSFYTSYWRGALPSPGPWHCETTGERVLPEGAGEDGGGLEVQLRSYRVAVAATGEYTAFASLPNAPNVADGLAAVATSINRVNGLYRIDLDINLILVSNNDQVIYTDAATDPFSGNMAAMQGQNAATLDGVIGSGNYDLGHLCHQVAGAGGSGNAGGIGSVCTALKGRGFTSAGAPTGTFYWIDYLAHEMGHQLGGNHSYNGIGGNCGAQRVASAAYEPGSGISVMGYAGICDSDNLATANPPTGASLPMFGFRSIVEISASTSAMGCGQLVDTGNHRPGATAPAGPFYVPTRTPFRLWASATHYESPELNSVSWEQADLGPARALGADTGANEPLFRNFMHSPFDGSQERLIPRLSTILSGTPALGETDVLFNRTSTFRAVVRDNNAQAGGCNMADTVVQFVQVPGNGFKVTAPGAGAYCAGQTVTVTWNVAGTNQPPFNNSQVDIVMSFDGGQTWPYGLASEYPNNGSAVVTLPAFPTTQARIKVQPVGGIFFSISPGNLEITPEPPSIAVQPQPISACPGDSRQLTVTATVGPIVRYQWRKGSSNIAGATNPTLPLPAMSYADTGDYDCVLSNGCGTVITNAVRVQVGVSFDAQPLDQSVQPCQTVSLGVQARGVGSLAYQWRRNGVAMTPEPHITGIAGPTLTFNGIRQEDDAKYECAVTDSCGTRPSNPAAITLPTPPWVQTPMNAAPHVALEALSPWTTAFDEHRGVLVMYGGLTFGGGSTNSLWEYDGIEWRNIQDGSTQINTSGGQQLMEGFWAPNVDEGIVMVYNPDDHLVYLIGDGSWAWPMAVWTWDGQHWQRPYYGPMMGGHSNYRAVYDRARHKILIVRSVNNGNTSESIYYDPVANTMSAPIAMQPALPTGVANSYLYYDERRQLAFRYANDIPEFQAPFLATFDGTSWTRIAGAAADFRGWRDARWEYDPVRGVVNTMGSYVGDAFGWYTFTWQFPSGARWGTALPPANDWSTLLPDGAPRNPGGASLSPVNNWRTRAMTFDRRRRAMVASGYLYPGPLTWRTYERRYLDAPMFDRAPRDVPLVIGQPAVLRAYGAGAGTLAYRWTRNGQTLANGPAPGGGTISGATTDTLTINPAGGADAGQYTCTITNACGSLQSAPALLGTGSIACAPADIATEGSADPLAGPDGFITGTDFDLFVIAYFAETRRGDGSLIADITGSDGFGGPDGFVTGTDFDRFVEIFFVGC